MLRSLEVVGSPAPIVGGLANRIQVVYQVITGRDRPSL